MRIACLGGGPAGLYFAILMKLSDPRHDVVVIERNKPYDTFGWGVVLSDETLTNLARNDADSAAEIRKHFVYWDDIAVHHRGTVQRSGGHGFCGIGRRTLLSILQDRAKALGVVLHFETEIGAVEIYSDYDLIVAADGVSSKIRSAAADIFKPDLDVRACKYIWLGTRQTFAEAFTFVFEETTAGWIWAHAYQFEPDTATFIVECSEATWRGLGFDALSTEDAIAACEKIFARTLGGHALMSNARHLRGSAWLNFNRVLCERWSHGNVVLMGDAAATAHFSVGSGTKLALESAIALADYLQSEPTLAQAFARYEADRRLEVLKLQNAARNSTEWFEDVERYLHLDPVQFNYSHSPARNASVTKTCGSATRPGSKARRRGSMPALQASSQQPRARRCSCLFVCARCSCPIASSSPRWRSIARWMACPANGTSSTMPSVPRAARGWSSPK